MKLSLKQLEKNSMRIFEVIYEKALGTVENFWKDSCKTQHKHPFWVILARIIEKNATRQEKIVGNPIVVLRNEPLESFQ